jgi:hypothetical protein
MSEMREIRLPAELCAAAEEKFRGKFGSLDEMLAVVLQELLREDSSRADEAERKMVEERLRELGYI